MEYFAYGSNMNPERMKQRIGWSPPSRGAVLQDYQLMFDKQSNDGGKANIHPLKGESVEGVLYQLAEKDLLSLDGFEGVSTGDYAREKLEVSINGDGKCLATAYIALKTGPENPPTRRRVRGDFASRFHSHVLSRSCRVVYGGGRPPI